MKRQIMAENIQESLYDLRSTMKDINEFLSTAMDYANNNVVNVVGKKSFPLTVAERTEGIEYDLVVVNDDIKLMNKEMDYLLKDVDFLIKAARANR